MTQIGGKKCPSFASMRQLFLHPCACLAWARRSGAFNLLTQLFQVIHIVLILSFFLIGGGICFRLVLFLVL
jgi:hypothetical protein